MNAGEWMRNRQDAGPVLRIVGKAPDAWYDFARSLHDGAQAGGDKDLPCDIDRAQGFLCGGGLNLE